MPLCAEMVPAETLRKMMEELIPMPRMGWLIPDPREVDPFPGKIWFRLEPYDDGGGPVIAAIRYQRFT